MMFCFFKLIPMKRILKSSIGASPCYCILIVAKIQEQKMLFKSYNKLIKHF